jgi:hypothetical protein
MYKPKVAKTENEQIEAKAVVQETPQPDVV